MVGAGAGDNAGVGGAVGAAGAAGADASAGFAAGTCTCAWVGGGPGGSGGGTAFVAVEATLPLLQFPFKQPISIDRAQAAFIVQAHNAFH